MQPNIVKRIVLAIVKFVLSIFEDDNPKPKSDSTVKKETPIADTSPVIPKQLRDNNIRKARRVLNKIAVQLTAYSNLLESCKFELPAGFAKGEDGLLNLNDYIRAGSYLKALKVVINDLARRNIDSLVASNQMTLDRIKGDPTYPYDNFRKLEEIIARQELIIKTIKGEKERLYDMLSKITQSEKEILDKKFK